MTYRTKWFGLEMLILCFVLLFSNTAVSQERTETENFEGFEEYVKKVMEEWKVPGLAIGVVKANEIVYMEGFGYRDIEKKLPVETQTLFSIGSCTKSFTAAAIGMQIDAGELEWDSPLIEFLPDFQLYDEYSTLHLTPRDLLLHRTGISGHNQVKNTSSLDRNSLLKILRYLQPSKSFRESFQYANVNYQIAGYVVDRLSGDSFEQYITDQIFKPLGMNNSTFFVGDRSKGNNIAQPYMNFGTHDNWGEPVLNSHYFSINRQNQNITAPSGGIYSNVEDMVEWIRLNMNRGKAGDHQIISASSLRAIHTPSMGLGYYPDDKMSPFSAFGMGWSIEPFEGHYLIHSDGQVYGYMADISFMPYENIGVVVLTNMYYHHLCLIVSKHIYERLLGLELTDRSTDSYASFKNASDALEKSVKEFWPNRSDVKKSTQSLYDYKGIYENPGYGKIVIDFKNNRLSAIFKNAYEVQLRHYDENVFATESDILSYNHVKISFMANETGSIDTITIPFEQSVDAIVFTRVKSD